MSITYSTQNTAQNGIRRMTKLVSFSGVPVTYNGSRRQFQSRTNTAVTFTGLGGANFSTARSKFGPGSLDVEAVGKYITRSSYNTTSTGNGYPSGTGDFCIEGWLWMPTGRSSAAGATGVPISLAATNGGLGVRFGTGYKSGTVNNLQIWARGALDGDYAAITWPRDQWVHWAVQRRSATISLWANGNKLARTGGGNASTYSFSATTSTLIMGNNDLLDEATLSSFDEVCVSNTWRYDDTTLTTYTPPTVAITPDIYTNLLIHFDSDLITATT